MYFLPAGRPAGRTDGRTAVVRAYLLACVRASRRGVQRNALQIRRKDGRPRKGEKKALCCEATVGGGSGV